MHVCMSVCQSLNVFILIYVCRINVSFSLLLPDSATKRKGTVLCSSAYVGIHVCMLQSVTIGELKSGSTPNFNYSCIFFLQLKLRRINGKI